MPVTIGRRTFLQLAAGGALGTAGLGVAISQAPRARELYVRLMRPHVGPLVEKAE